ncbi:MAG: metallophosphoesterase [Oligoflexia bacterium]|nr:metallophosphoesterase [Oligoflexia bacterium]
MGTRYKIVISDCHLSAGRFHDGHLNPHEDFHFDDEMCRFFDYFSNGKYGEGPDGPVEVELFLNGDYFDFLNVPLGGEFEEAISEDMALQKLEAILAGHTRVMDALRRFAAKPGKRITYMVGNHDAELFFPRVRERIVREWDPRRSYPSETVQVLSDRNSVRWEGGVEVHHGNQFEKMNALNFEKPLIESYANEPVLNLPWGSFYVLKIINRLKWEREYLDKVRPVRLYVLIGLIMDPWFTIRFVFLSFFYFLKTRFIYSSKRDQNLRDTAAILRQEAANHFLDLERQARRLLDEKPELRTVIFGHTHKPMHKVYPDGKQYINTGTWTKMINLDWRGLGSQFCLTFALVKIDGDEARCDLRHWVGEHSPHKVFQN